MLVSPDFLQQLKSPDARKFNKPILTSANLKPYTTTDGRKYVNEENNKAYTSVTTFLGKTSDKSNITAWKKRIGEQEAERITKEAAANGNKIHKALELWFENRWNPDTYWNNSNIILDEESGQIVEIDASLFTRRSDHEKIRFNNVQSLIDFDIDTLYGNELTVYSNTLSLAGRLDFIYKSTDGKIVLADLKTSNKPKVKKYMLNYFIQLAIYSIMVWEQYGIEVDHCKNFYSYDDGTADIVPSCPMDYLDELMERHKTFFKSP